MIRGDKILMQGYEESRLVIKAGIVLEDLVKSIYIQ